MSPRDCFLAACALDVAVRKPGNVSAALPGHGMDAALFLASAEAAAPALFQAGAPVGARIEAAVAATLAVARCNTNLGIVLLCAPLALAFEQGSAPRPALERVLSGLDIADAAGAYRAIAAAQPGGLGRAEAQDVAAPPTVGLRAAMALAAPRDRIAAQYANGYADLFELALPALERHASSPGRPIGPAAVQALYLALLASGADSHILRKHGAPTAQAVTAEAAAWQARAESGQVLDADPDFAAWDASLKARGINPGTSADLTVAALFIAGALDKVTLPAYPR